ncbi:uncharacterized protein LOC117791099 [Drosophila innubila]|uniref:uncharacterized protein LOC117791099 n=1 Tax=Drosophila innubila TaxID=198719 RepID=UPI00148DAA1D|nr:uncharacterized protein LOC117791099 [Drosophila innubila]
MSLIHEILNQQLRHLLRAKRRSDDRRTDYAINKRSRNRWRYQCNRRCPGGQDPRSTCPRTETISSNIRLNRRASLPVGNHCIVPLLHIWLRLNEVTPASTNASRQRCMYRFQLRQRSLLDNVRQVIRIHWNNFRQMIMPASEQTTVGTQTGRRQQVEIVRCIITQNRITWLQKLRRRFELISKQLESALTNVGPSPDYVNTSAAMELINLADLIEQLNSALIDHLINNENYAISPTPSLTQLGIFFPV